MNTSTVNTTIPSSPAAPTRMRRMFGVVNTPQTYRNLVYLLLGLPLGTLWFAVLITGFAVGASMLVVALTGIPILLAMWYVTRVFANIERATANALLGSRLGWAPMGPHASGNPWRRIRALSADRNRWRELSFLLIRFPVGVATFTAAIVATAVPLTIAYAPLAARIDNDEPFGDWRYGDRLDQIFSSAWSVLAVPAAALIFVVSLHLLNGLAGACRRWAQDALA